MSPDGYTPYLQETTTNLQIEIYVHFGTTLKWKDSKHTSIFPGLLGSVDEKENVILTPNSSQESLERFKFAICLSSGVLDWAMNYIYHTLIFSY